MNPTPEQIRKARHSAGLTQQKAAEYCCVTKAAYGHWEYGIRKMPENAWQLFLLKIEQSEEKI